MSRVCQIMRRTWAVAKPRLALGGFCLAAAIALAVLSLAAVVAAIVFLIYPKALDRALDVDINLEDFGLPV